MNSMEVYGNLVQPPLSLPDGFPVVWGILFVLMGISSYLVYASGEPGSRSVLTVYAVQLVVNFFWSIIFFNMQAYAFAFFWLLLLWILVVVSDLAVRKNKPHRRLASGAVPVVADLCGLPQPVCLAAQLMSDIFPSLSTHTNSRRKP